MVNGAHQGRFNLAQRRAGKYTTIFTGSRSSQMTTKPQVVEALAHREVGFTVAILPPVRRWGPLLKHLQAMHRASTPNGDRNQVVNPSRLADWHAQCHLDEDGWIVLGSPPATPHRHLGLLGRLRVRYE